MVKDTHRQMAQRLAQDSNRVDTPFWTPPDPSLYVLPPPPVYVCRRPSLESIADEISEAAAAAGTEPGGGAGEGAGGRGPLGGDSGHSEPVAGSGGVGVQPWRGAQEQAQLCGGKLCR